MADNGEVIQSSPPKATQTTTTPYSMADTLKDVFLWRRKRFGAAIVSVSTVIWAVMEVYRFNFVTVASWTGMVLVATAFLWGNILRLVGKPSEETSKLEISEDYVANSCRTLIEGVIRWMFDVTVEGDLFTFARVISGIFLLSYIGSSFDFLTLVYLGILMGMTVPMIYMNYEDKITRQWERAKIETRRIQKKIEETVTNKFTKKKNDETNKFMKKKNDDEVIMKQNNDKSTESMKIK